MAKTVEKLLLGNVMSDNNKATLLLWMKNNTTGNKRIRTGLPLGWSAAEKTGSGHYGIANDIGIVWSPACKPIVLAIYTVGINKEDKGNNEIIAHTTQLVLDEFAKDNACFEIRTI